MPLGEAIASSLRRRSGTGRASLFDVRLTEVALRSYASASCTRLYLETLIQSRIIFYPRYLQDSMSV